MKKILAILLLVPTLAFAQAKAPKQPKGVLYDAQIIRVSDGDTIVIAAPFYLHPLSPSLLLESTELTHPKKDGVVSNDFKYPTFYSYS
jgi:hypothetical protein